MKTEVTIYKFFVALLGFAGMVIASPLVPIDYIKYVAQGITGLTAILVWAAPYLRQAPPDPPTVPTFKAGPTVTDPANAAVNVLPITA